MSPKNFGNVSLTFAGINVDLKTKHGLPPLRGAAYVGEQECGEWQLKPAPVLKETSSSLLSANFMELRGWMRKRSELLKIQDRLSDLETKKVTRQENFEKLNEALEDQDNLIVRSKNKRQELTDRINQVSEQRRRVTQQAREAIMRLNLLFRISPVGQIVDLNRRIARRENRWFTAEWGMVVDEFDKKVAEALNVPLDQVPVLSRRAEEVERLRLALNTERKKVAELESAAVRQEQHQVSQTNTEVRVLKRVPVPVVERGLEPEQRREWWDVF
jgi:DNA repair exonuclease SbcCD ATPase subunit